MSEGEQRPMTYRVRIGIGVFFIVVGIVTIFTGGRIGFSNIQSAALILNNARVASDSAEHGQSSRSVTAPRLAVLTSFEYFARTPVV